MASNGKTRKAAMPTAVEIPEHIVLDKHEAAPLLGVSERTFCRMCESGELRAVKVAGKWRVGRDWLLGYLGLIEG